MFRFLCEKTTQMPTGDSINFCARHKSSSVCILKHEKWIRCRLVGLGNETTWLIHKCICRLCHTLLTSRSFLFSNSIVVEHIHLAQHMFSEYNRNFRSDKCWILNELSIVLSVSDIVVLCMVIRYRVQY